MRVVLKQIIFSIGMCMLSVTAAFAGNVAELNLSKSGLALRGIDPVSYFTASKPAQGSKAITLSHKGGKYRFSSEKNKDLFQKNPGKYLPAFGGYCAYGTATGVKVDGDPNVWHIVNDRLYLNITRSVDRLWQSNTKGYIQRANSNWPKIKYN